MQNQNSYQVQIWDLQKQIFRCEDCHEEIPDNVLGPDSIFVGEQYGTNPEIPKILFIGINPNSLESEFGTRRNIIQIYESDYETTVNSTQYYQDFLHGTPDFGGFDQINIYTSIWGIRRLLTSLYDIDGMEENFAMTNAIQCTGPNNDNDGFPNRTMIKQCLERRWLRRTIEILTPDIIFIFSVGETRDSTWSLFTHVVDNEDCETRTPSDWTYLPIINTPNGPIQPLTFAIPHFVRPNLSANCFRNIRDELRESGSINWGAFIEMIKTHIRENTAFGERLI